jgi:4-hydroxy-3-methylbut-2-enyl diphosphate reductase
VKVLVARSAGFCWGVRRAVERALELARATPGPVHTDGPLIHNEQVMRRLHEAGVHETDAPESLHEGVLLVRAHGIPPERRTALRQLPVRLVDCTCRDVARIQGRIKAATEEGRTVIIYGDPGHAEVVGLLGFARGRGRVVASVAEAAALPDLSPCCLVAQSTQFPDAYAEVAVTVRRRCRDVVVLDTICEATKRRQDELRELAAQVDAFVVVGSRHSANTLRLAELARSLKPTIHVETGAELRPADVQGFRVVGLSAGASTPDEEVAAVRQRLESY